MVRGRPRTDMGQTFGPRFVGNLQKASTREPRRNGPPADAVGAPSWPADVKQRPVRYLFSNPILHSAERSVTSPHRGTLNAHQARRFPLFTAVISALFHRLHVENPRS